MTTYEQMREKFIFIECHLVVANSNTSIITCTRFSQFVRSQTSAVKSTYFNFSSFSYHKLLQLLSSFYHQHFFNITSISLCPYPYYGTEFTLAISLIRSKIVFPLNLLCTACLSTTFHRSLLSRNFRFIKNLYSSSMYHQQSYTNFVHSCSTLTNFLPKIFNMLPIFFLPSFSLLSLLLQIHLRYLSLAQFINFLSIITYLL